MTSHDLVKWAPSRLYRKRDGIGQTPCSYERYLVTNTSASCVTVAAFYGVTYCTFVVYIYSSCLLFSTLVHYVETVKHIELFGNPALRYNVVWVPEIRVISL